MSRPERTGKVLDFEAARRDRALTQQQAADDLGVPRTTLLGWAARAAAAELTPAQRTFFESPDGVQFLRVLLTASLFVMNLSGGLGVAMVRTFLTLTGLHTLVACSESSLRKTRTAMIDAIGAWGDTQDAALAAGMAPKDILVGFDENFHRGMTLVAMEATSGFLLVEKAAERRDAKTWAAALREGIRPWPVTIVGLIGDEAKGLIRCALQELGVLKGSDLFHVQYEIGRGVSGAVGRLVRAAEKARDQAAEALAAVKKAREAYAQASHGPGRPPAWQAREEAAAGALAEAEAAVVTAASHRDAVRDAVRDLGDRYHPVDLATGAQGWVTIPPRRHGGRTRRVGHEVVARWVTERAPLKPDGARRSSRGAAQAPGSRAWTSSWVASVQAARRRRIRSLRRLTRWRWHSHVSAPHTLAGVGRVFAIEHLRSRALRPALTQPARKGQERLRVYDRRLRRGQFDRDSGCLGVG